MVGLLARHEALQEIQRLETPIYYSHGVRGHQVTVVLTLPLNQFNDCHFADSRLAGQIKPH